MARPKKPQDETIEQADVRKDLESIANYATRSEKTAFSRKIKNMETLIEKLRPIEQQIIKLMAKKMPIIDEVSALRETMIMSCVHPIEYLVHRGTHIECKFCCHKINVPSK